MIVQGKSTVTTYIGPSFGPVQEQLLKSLIPSEAPYRTFKDAHGYRVWEKNAVTFVSDVLPAGLVKKMQLWLKKILKLNLKLRVRKTSGEVEESEGEDLHDDLLRADPADAPDRGQASHDFQQRLARLQLQPDIRRALAGALAEQIRALVSSIAQHAKHDAYDDADAELDEIEALSKAMHRATASRAMPTSRPKPRWRRRWRPTRPRNGGAIARRRCRR